MYFTPSEKKKELALRLLILGGMVSLVLTSGTFVYHFSEDWSYLDSLYFATISLTSRGYSDLRPTNWFSVLFSVFYLLVGVSVLIYSLSTLISYYTSYYQDRINAAVKKFTSKKKPKKWVVLNHKKILKGIKTT